MTIIEVWKDIVNHEEFYEVSNYGRVRNKKKQNLIVGDVNNFGYYRVCLYMPFKKRVFRHRLVALHFIVNDSPDTKTQVNHIDGDKSNNIESNLEWVTPSDNDLHAFRTGLKNVVNKKKVKVTFPDGEEKIFDSNTEASRYFGYTSTAAITFAIQRGGWIKGAMKGIKICNV